MLNHSEMETIEGDAVRAMRAAERTHLKALGAGLPPDLDKYLNELVEAATKQTSKRGGEVHRLLSAFAAAAYTDAEFEATLAALDTSQTGSTAHAQLCAWILGVPLLKDLDRARAAEALLALLRKRPKQLLMPTGKRLLRTLRWTAGIASVLPGIAFGVTLLVGLLGLPEWQNFQYTVTLLVEFAVFSSLIIYPNVLVCLRHNEIENAGDLRFIAAHALGRLQAVQAVDALSVACRDGNEYVGKMATLSLRCVLPNLTHEHYGQLGSEVVPKLCGLLKQCFPLVTTAEHTDYRFALELLGALEKVGDARAIPIVQQAVRNYQAPTLIETSIRTLNTLEERRRRETERITLLRGSGPAAVSEGELLRPASAQADAAPEQLLRPVE